ncbi:hypothetical protein B0H11DRAFT_1937293 [Mycena galericulata]|nr:hypothetical protein B0H11DRAFT_1937293 [Mycena galericulata]
MLAWLARRSSRTPPYPTAFHRLPTRHRPTNLRRSCAAALEHTQAPPHRLQPLLTKPRPTNSCSRAAATVGRMRAPRIETRRSGTVHLYLRRAYDPTPALVPCMRTLWGRGAGKPPAGMGRHEIQMRIRDRVGQARCPSRVRAVVDLYGGKRFARGTQMRSPRAALRGGGAWLDDEWGWRGERGVREREAEAVVEGQWVWDGYSRGEGVVCAAFVACGGSTGRRGAAGTASKFIIMFKLKFLDSECSRFGTFEASRGLSPRTRAAHLIVDELNSGKMVFPRLLKRVELWISSG